jgi:hypothetical protein
MNMGSEDELNAQIINAVASVTSQTVENTWHETEYHWDALQLFELFLQAMQTVSQYLLYFVF